VSCSRPTLRRSVSGLVLHRYALAAAAASHLLHVGSVFQRLPEVADVAGDVFVAVNGQRQDGLPAAVMLAKLAV
jgi:hypothetical protein